MPNLEDGGSFKADEGELTCMMVNLARYKWDPNFIQGGGACRWRTSRVSSRDERSRREGEKNTKGCLRKEESRGIFRGVSRGTFRGARGIYC
jgi:hypothetical protein